LSCRRVVVQPQSLFAQQAQRDRTDSPTLATMAAKFTLDVNDKDALGRTPLHLAAAGNHASAVKCLLLHGADPALCDDDGNTCAAVAAASNSSNVMRLLSDPSVLFWNASVRANRLYNDKKFDLAISAYSASITFAGDAALVRHSVGCIDLIRFILTCSICCTGIEHVSTGHVDLALQ
jgi:hypothetical protein